MSSAVRASLSTSTVAPMPRMAMPVMSARNTTHQTHTGTPGRYWCNALAAMSSMIAGVMRYCRIMSQPTTKPTPVLISCEA